MTEEIHSVHSKIVADRENTAALRMKREKNPAALQYESERPRAKPKEQDANLDPGAVEFDGPPVVANEGAAPATKEDSFHLFEVILNAEDTHPSSKAFYDRLILAGLLHAKKQRDYGRVGDPFANVRSTAEFGVDGWIGAMIRLNDKVKRLQSLARQGVLHNESAIDSFMDIAVYALIACVLYMEQGVEEGSD